MTGGQPQDYSVTMTGGTSLDTFLVATAAPMSSPGFEPRLALYDGTGKLLVQSDQPTSGLSSATVEQHLRTASYYLKVSAASSSSASANRRMFQLTTTVASSSPPLAPLPVGGNPYAVAVTDLGNGNYDIVTANAGTNSVSVALGNGDGTFRPAQSHAVGSDPDSATIADLGIGQPDIITANCGANTVSVLLNAGNGRFHAAQSVAVGRLRHRPSTCPHRHRRPGRQRHWGFGGRQRSRQYGHDRFPTSQRND
jgi:hypothetical protein